MMVLVYTLLRFRDTGAWSSRKNSLRLSPNQAKAFIVDIHTKQAPLPLIRYQSLLAKGGSVLVVPYIHEITDLGQSPPPPPKHPQILPLML